MPEVTQTATDFRLADDGEYALEPFCAACGGRAGIFTSRGGAWLHYIGELDDYTVEPYDPGHPPVIGWRPTPGIVFVAR
ncbi:MAG TPA: hypothetical protein VH136_17925 [Trebonia sp.]|nr:hypothetical protein [Trebonia sp.]